MIETRYDNNRYREKRRRREGTNNHCINAHTHIYILERRNNPTYMRGREESICMYDIHIECTLKNTNEYVMESYQGSYQYVMYLGILELTYNWKERKKDESFHLNHQNFSPLQKVI
jgi:hypothetical protein